MMNKIQNDELVAACRPYDIQLIRDESFMPERDPNNDENNPSTFSKRGMGGLSGEHNVRGVIKRVAYLGAIVDYRIELGGREIRVQMDIQDVHDEEKSGLVFTEGDRVGIRFLELKWFSDKGIEEEVS
jgi:FKBP-type peptidyl-prolyl cis-trans isomerase 2